MHSYEMYLVYNCSFDPATCTDRNNTNIIIIIIIIILIIIIIIDY